jgi:hypothetical protein
MTNYEKLISYLPSIYQKENNLKLMKRQVHMKRLLVTLLIITSSIWAFDNPKADFAIAQVILAEGEKLDTSIGTIHSKYGITRPTLKSYNGSTKVENLTKSQAKEIIYKLYWLDYGLDRFMDKRNALLVLDFIYNSNPINAIKQIQKALGNNVTGKLSVGDIAEINYMGYNDFYTIYARQRLGYMKKLKVWNKFKNGFKNRIENLGEL